MTATRRALRLGADLLGRTAGTLDRAARALQDGARTARFLRGRLAFDARKSDVFVASYPRSGTTWTQLIVHYLVTGASEPSFSHIADVSPWWERSLAWRDDAPAGLAALPSPRVFKTHLPLRWLPRGARYVYVRRRPEDVAVSYYHLYRRYLRFDGPFDAFFERFVRGDVQYRSWFRHVAGWERHAGHPSVLHLEYEEMAADPASAVRRIAAFLGVGVGDARAAAIAARTRFDEMKAHEDKFDHVGELCRQWGIEDGAFLRRGVVAGGEGVVTSAQRERLRRAMEKPVPLPGVEWRLPAFLH